MDTRIIESYKIVNKNKGKKKCNFFFLGVCFGWGGVGCGGGNGVGYLDEFEREQSSQRGIKGGHFLPPLPFNIPVHQLLIVIIVAVVAVIVITRDLVSLHRERLSPVAFAHVVGYNTASL